MGDVLVYMNFVRDIWRDINSSPPTIVFSENLCDHTHYIFL